jgi:murein tripeptide amidase MpaA
MHIDDDFDSGNIDVISLDGDTINLRIKDDPYPKHVKDKYNYWFYFKVSDVEGRRLTYNIHKLRNYENCWKGFHVAMSYDNKNWTRHNTKLKKNTLTWTLISKKRTVWFAYYVPYPFSRTKKLFKNDEIIGYSKNRNPIYMKTFGKGPKYIWIVARQHPGETIGSWILEGFMKKMKKIKNFTKIYTCKIIGNANPDGTIMGHWRLNKDGVNLNRDWKKEKSPEVRCIKKTMMNEEQGWDLCFDLHGDEGSFKHFVVRDNTADILEDRLYDLLKTSHFQSHNSSPHYSKTPPGTLGNSTGFVWMRVVCIEGAMKHRCVRKTLQENPLMVGERLAMILISDINKFEYFTD